MGMIKTVAQAWKIPEIRSKIIFTLMMLLVFRIGSNIPVPNINREALSTLFVLYTYGMGIAILTAPTCIASSSFLKNHIPFL